MTNALWHPFHCNLKNAFSWMLQVYNCQLISIFMIEISSLNYSISGFWPKTKQNFLLEIQRNLILDT